MHRCTWKEIWKHSPFRATLCPAHSRPKATVSRDRFRLRPCIGPLRGDVCLCRCIHQCRSGTNTQFSASQITLSQIHSVPLFVVLNTQCQVIHSQLAWTHEQVPNPIIAWLPSPPEMHKHVPDPLLSWLPSPPEMHKHVPDPLLSWLPSPPEMHKHVPDPLLSWLPSPPEMHKHVPDPLLAWLPSASEMHKHKIIIFTSMYIILC